MNFRPCWWDLLGGRRRGLPERPDKISWPLCSALTLTVFANLYPTLPFQGLLTERGSGVAAAEEPMAGGCRPRPRTPNGALLVQDRGPRPRPVRPGGRRDEELLPQMTHAPDGPSVVE